MNPNRVRLFRTAAITLWLVGLIVIVVFVPPGDDRVRNTARWSLVFWATAAFTYPRSPANARTLWILAGIAYLVHVAVAFQDAHYWSHAKAFQHVEETSGFGPGIFVSYFFTLVWTAELIWLGLSPGSYLWRPRWVNLALHGFMVFIIINATIIFENGATRWISVGVLVCLSWWWNRAMKWDRHV
ncbi:MAG: hypothetical protein K8T89_12915 [Planctomycetes bacterium]|nr:hypothetical protein [Planctomycetota bacterium]